MMDLSLYDATIPVFIRALENLAAILTKAKTFAATSEGGPTSLLEARLIPDMAPLTAQIQRASDTAKGSAVRLGQVANAVFEDTEHSFPELQQRLARTIAFLQAVPQASFEGRADAAIALKFGPVDRQFTGRSFVTDFALPNFFFHVTTAYALLRQHGVNIGKADFLGWARTE